MVANRKPTGRAVSMPRGLAMGAAVSILWTILGAAVVAKLIDGEILREDTAGYGALLILLTASFSSALLAAGRIKRQRAVVCLSSGGIYYLLLLCITALFFGGQYQGMGVTALVILAGSVCAMLMGVGQGSGKKRKPLKPGRK